MKLAFQNPDIESKNQGGMKLMPQCLSTFFDREAQSASHQHRKVSEFFAQLDQAFVEIFHTPGSSVQTQSKNNDGLGNIEECSDFLWVI